MVRAANSDPEWGSDEDSSFDSSSSDGEEVHWKESLESRADSNGDCFALMPVVTIGHRRCALCALLILQLIIWGTWKLGRLPRWQACEFTGSLIASAFCVVRGPSGQTLPAPVRMVSTFAILAVTLAVTVYPLLEEACGSYASEFYSVLRVTICWMLACCAMLCTTSWHPASFTTRSAVHCVVLIWLQKVAWVTRSISGACDNVPDKDIVFGIASTACKIANFWVQLLVYLRLKALESSLRASLRTKQMKLQLVLFGISLLGEGLYVELLPLSVIGASHIGAALQNFFCFIRGANLLILDILYSRAFAVPLRALRSEMVHVSGAALAEARWATSILLTSRCPT